MRIKFIKRNEIEKYMDSEEGVVFLDSSPVSEISLTSRPAFTAFQGSLRARHGQGTLSVFHHDSNDTILLKKYDYSFDISPNEEESKIVGPLKLEDHYLDDIPSSLKPYAPEWISDKVKFFRR